eukprot:gnl/Chilomastix_cuspidata/5737.p2 GENE.gnl/Chilomastix_cuspidata/5737~~gnl/Chilomastix_cuspidata/5737.p2  ORF type:complete len:187 (+),score=69.09 gnl/Chilomastix_cuspidata/5737:1030-1590(+)
MNTASSRRKDRATGPEASESKGPINVPHRKTSLELIALAAAHAPVSEAEAQHLAETVAELEAQLAAEAKVCVEPLARLTAQLTAVQDRLAAARARTDALAAAAHLPLFQAYELGAQVAVRAVADVLGAEVAEPMDTRELEAEDVADAAALARLGLADARGAAEEARLALDLVLAAPPPGEARAAEE